MEKEKQINNRTSWAEYENEYNVDDNNSVSEYDPSIEDKEELDYIRKDFYKTWLVQWKGRPEFDDLSIVDIVSRDQQVFNTYIPNGGQSPDWRNVSQKPIVRNNAIGVISNVASRIMFPSFYGVNENGELDKSISYIYDDLIEWSAMKKNYGTKYLETLYNIVSSPAGIMYVGYQNIKRKVKTGKKIKRKKQNSEEMEEVWETKEIQDEDLSGFQFLPVQVDQLYISNYYEPEIQKQDYIIWRRVISYELAKTKYANKYENFKYVKGGVKTIYSTTNQAFYDIYDYELTQYEVEEVLYWNKNRDVFHIVLNGVKLTEYGNPNPREDKLYPFAKTFYEYINPNFFYGKSLTHKGFSEAEALNNLWSNVLDGTYLSNFPPSVIMGSDVVTDEIISPGNVSVFTDPNSKLVPINVATNLTAGVNALKLLEESLDKSSPTPIQNAPTGTQTAFEIARIETNTATVLGLFVRMLSDFTSQVGRLMLGDIDQYYTLADITKISNKELVYKTFTIPNKKQGNKEITKQIQFVGDLGLDINDEKELEESFNILKEEEEKNITLIKANPKLIKEMKKVLVVKPNFNNNISEETKRQLGLEVFTLSAKLGGIVNLPELYKDLVLSSTEQTRENPDKYILQQNQLPQQSVSIPQQNNQEVNPKFEPSINNVLQ